MANLSEHFLERELRVEQQSERVKAIARWGCKYILEPLHAKFAPLVVTSGYRDIDRNKNAGGVQKSFHLYRDDQGAADCYAVNASVLDLFGWLRESELPFDKVILEYDKATGQPEVVHIQWDLAQARPRTAWVGMTHGQGGYVETTCA
jgi:hypothetical protein